MKNYISQKKLKTLFDLLDELYFKAQKESGMISLIPACYAENGSKFVVFSPNYQDSKELKSLVKKWGTYHSCGVKMKLIPDEADNQGEGGEND